MTQDIDIWQLVGGIGLFLFAMTLLESASLYDAENISLLHHVSQALRAHKMFSS